LPTWSSRNAISRVAPAALFAVGVTLQALHFAEEYGTRFYERFPAVLGLSAWSSRFFLIFNLCWLGIWIWAAFGLRAGYRPAFFPVWFLVIAAMANGIAHPLLSLQTGGYFPGLATSLPLGVIGIWLWSRLVRMTGRRGRSMRDHHGDGAVRPLLME
jgi:uncharacterized protein with HXXEE motif